MPILTEITERLVVIPDSWTESEASLSNTTSLSRMLVRILYERRLWHRGAAWKHLQHNSPSFVHRNRLHTPYRESLAKHYPSGRREDFKRNPFLQRHETSEDYWVWECDSWITRPAKKSDRAPKRPPKPKTSLQRLLEDDLI